MAATKATENPEAAAVSQTPRRSAGEKIQHLTPAEHAARGKAARAKTPRSSHAEWNPPADRPDPVALLEEQEETRVPELVPIRHGRMLVSPFTYYRGAAYPMAWDLSHTPVSGLRAQLCGDAHLSNFGGFASPERRLIFDINDFDETLPGPWEWDVKRLAVSFEVAARDRGFKKSERRAAVTTVVRSYREAMASFAEMSDLDVWYAHLDVESILPKVFKAVGSKGAKNVQRNIAKARTKDSTKAFAKLTHEVDGRPQIVSDPPLIVPVAELLADQQADAVVDQIRALLRQYRSSLQNDRRLLLEQFEYGDLARKVVGVGSVGTRCWIMLMLGRDIHDPLFLQVKEADASVLEKFLGASAFKNHGQRVVEGQRLMQAYSDIFLGWIRTPGIADRSEDYYFRQLWDWKVSVDVDQLSPTDLGVYAQLCGWTLARAHARSGDRIAIAAYLGNGTSFDEAIGDFSAAYADQNDADYAAFKAAVESGRLQAETGL